MNKSECLVIDIECYSDYDIDSPQYIQDAKIKWIGLYSFEKNKYYEVLIANHDENKAKVIDFINLHKTLISFNGNKFDIPILKNNGFITSEWIKSIDMWELLGNDKKSGCKNRGELMGYDFKSNSLKAMAEEMGLSVAKGDIDYRIFAKDEYTEEEKIEIKKYLKADVEITKQMFEKAYDFWLPFTELISEKNKKNWSWLKCSIASLVYKTACNLLNKEEEYSDGKKDSGAGAIVIEPTVEEAWDLYYCDVVSLYPHIYAMFNLMNEVGSQGENLWHGNNEFKVKGYYDISAPHKMSIILMDMLKKRIELKKIDKKNPLIYAYKIFLNTFYGANRNPCFKNIYTENSGEDCCLIGQQINRIMQRMFAEKGYDVLAGDTDSNFPKARTPKTEYEVEQDLKDIVNYINSLAPFPQPTFNIAIEHKIDYIMFVKDEEKTLKKNYAYIWTDVHGERQVEVMGLPVIKSTATNLGKIILGRHIIPRMKKELKGKFEKEWISNLIDLELKDNMHLIAQEYKCQPYDSYKLSARGCIWAQISKAYLNGKGGYIKLIKNKRIGKVGDENKYCSIEEAEKYKLQERDLDLTKVMNELAPFTQRKALKQGGLFSYA